MLRVARWVSILAHPFVMILVWITAVTMQLRGPGALAGNVGLVLVIVVVPNVVFMIRQVRRGAWGNVDASQRHERVVLYVIGLATVALLVAWLALGQDNSFLLRGSAVALALLGLSAVTSRWIKVSLHLAAAGLVGTSLLWLGSGVGWIVAAIVPPLAWSRLALARHSRLEVALGLVYGVLAGAAIHVL
jgi:hypothetical protein